MTKELLRFGFIVVAIGCVAVVASVFMGIGVAIVCRSFESKVLDAKAVSSFFTLLKSYAYGIFPGAAFVIIGIGVTVVAKAKRLPQPE